MAGYIGSKASVTVTSPETDSRYVNTSGDTMTSDLDVEGNITSDNGNGNFVSLTTDGAIEVKRSNGQGYIDFKGSDVDFDCRIAQYSNGLQFTTGGSGSTANALTIDSNKRLRTPYQPACSAHTGAAWLNMQANTAYGIGGFHYNRGGFYTGSSVGGYTVIHVPATGLYRVTLHVYAANNNNGRIYVKKNNATDVCFIQLNSSSVDRTEVTEGLIEMTAGDYLNYYLLNTINTYHANHHTYVMVEYIG